MRLKRKWKIHNRKSLDTLLKRADRKENKPYRCPCCNKALYRHSYHEDYWGEVEGGYICEVCDYRDYFCYGEHIVAAGKWEGYYGYNADEKEVNQIRNEFTKQIRIAKQARKRNRQLYYSKKNRQRKAA
ncbi:hypothetical protein HP567_012905 [Brevibacillus sp. M2.1A]|uniref:hypothetical protein n=1 Tax=Brevibacillus sp. M2.1A TaxID=2738980 RepID=UPI00156AE468|nr:hypothetical protein [Brevibacillus sp. M2.1A]MCC8435445.1 hypothetical protein [Brevibacillus sp. M2.1A]